MNVPERTWTAHVLAYLFFVIFCFIDSLRYFSCEQDISTKIDAQENGYKADGVLELFERLRQILLFLLEVSESPNQIKLMKIEKKEHLLILNLSLSIKHDEIHNSYFYVGLNTYILI